MPSRARGSMRRFHLPFQVKVLPSRVGEGAFIWVRVTHSIICSCSVPGVRS